MYVGERSEPLHMGLQAKIFAHRDGERRDGARSHEPRRLLSQFGRNQKVINTGHNNSNGVSMELASVISHTTQKLRKQASLNEYEGEQRRASGASIALNMKPPGRHGVNSQIFRRDTNQNLQTSPGRDYRGPLESNMLMTPDISQQLVSPLP